MLLIIAAMPHARPRLQPYRVPTSFPAFHSHGMPQRGYMFVVNRVRNLILAPSGLRYITRSVAPMGHNRIYTMCYKHVAPLGHHLL